jgi:hypothetical protein
MRRMSFAYTKDAIREQRKKVTRRTGITYLNAKAEDERLAVSRLRAPADQVEIFGPIIFSHVRVEPLHTIERLPLEEGRLEVRLECVTLPKGHRCGLCHGEFDDCPGCFVHYFVWMNKCLRSEPVARIEFRYVDEVSA